MLGEHKVHKGVVHGEPALVVAVVEALGMLGCSCWEGNARQEGRPTEPDAQHAGAVLVEDSSLR